jgi:hypothetical protein
MKTKKCSKCGVEKELCEFHKQSSNKTGYRASCKNCRKTEKEKNKLYKEKNKEKIRINNNIWLKNNSDYMKKYQKEYNLKNREKLNLKLKKWKEKNREKNLEKVNKNKKEKYDNNLEYKLKHLLRSRINKILKFKRNKSSVEVLGCTIDDFIKYIGSKFLEGMSWDNYGYYGWHIDHIIPLSSGKTEEEILKLCHYTNLQPLWAKQNLKKSNKII